MKGGAVIAYVGVPDLPIQVEHRRRSELRGRPLIVTRWSEAGRGVVEAVSDEAMLQGVLPGQTPRQAEARCPEAVVVSADPAAYEAAFAALLRMLGGCSPIIQPDRAGWGVELDAGGLELLFGPPPRLAAELVRRAGRAGLRARVGLGLNRLVARLAAGTAAGGGAVVVGPSETRAFLEPLPIDDLPLSEETRERLELLGVQTLGRLLGLPRAGLARQVGPDALALARAVEAAVEPLAPYRPAEWVTAETLVESPLETSEDFARLAGPLLERLAEQLRERHLGAGAVCLRLVWAGGRRVSHAVQLPAPTAQVGALLEAAQTALARSLANGGRSAAARTGRVGGRPGAVGGEAPMSGSGFFREGPQAGALGWGRVAPRAGGAGGRVGHYPDPLPDEGRGARERGEGLWPDSLELALGDLAPLGGQQAGLFEGQRQRRGLAARAVEEMVERFGDRLRAPMFGRGVV